MKRRKIFVSLNVDEATQKYILKKIESLKESLNASWTAPSQFHVTLSFLGFVSDEEVSKICQDLRDALQGSGSFDLFFDTVELAPSASNPKMLWLKGATSKELFQVKKTMSAVVLENFHEKKESLLKPHITLARLKRKQTASIEEISTMLKKISLKILVPVSTVDIMESIHENGSWKHFSLEQIEL